MRARRRYDAPTGRRDDRGEALGDDGPVQIADQVWWVGVRLPNDRFQCHAYYLDIEGNGVLLDPGSPLTIEATLAKVARIAPLESIAYLVCHHADPDISASLPYLSEHLTRPDVQLVTEWRAAALLKHYGHRFGYYLVEEHGWRLPLAGDRRLEFQLTPYLHFPGALVSFDTATRTLFSSDLFGGFVPDNEILVADDADYIIENARPFHQHYMPSTELLAAGLTRVQHRWPQIDRIAPQHGHVIPGPLVDAAFEGLKEIECGVFALADADLDLQRLLHIAEARTQITDALLTIADPTALVGAMNGILAATHEARDCALFIDLPDQGWTMWGLGHSRPVRRRPPEDWPTVALPGEPVALLAIHTADDAHPDADLLDMLRGLAATVRPAIDQYLNDFQQARRVADLRRAAMTDPLTGLGNRRALEAHVPAGDYSLISLDLDHFKLVNDTYGHPAGDGVLSQVAAVLVDSVRHEDAVYRIGGEEFLLVLPAAPEDRALQVAERIRSAVPALDLTGQAPDGRVTVSIGLVTVEDGHDGTFRDALKAADSALYASKANGRNRVTVASADPTIG
jgi:two-component system, cell cycle response regulator